MCFFWFHPGRAGGWSRSIQLAREEVVDELAILLTGRRKAYVEALLAFADTTSVVPTACVRAASSSCSAASRSFRRRMSCRHDGLLLLRRDGADCWHSEAGMRFRRFRCASSGAGLRPAERARARSSGMRTPSRRRTRFRGVSIRGRQCCPISPGVTGGTVVVKVTLDERGRIAEARVVEMAVRGADFKLDVCGSQTSRHRWSEARQRTGAETGIGVQASGSLLD